MKFTRFEKFFFSSNAYIFTALAVVITFFLAIEVSYSEKNADTLQNRTTEAQTDHSSNTSQRTKVRIGIYENEPKIFTDENGKHSGIFADVIEEIAIRENWELIYIPCQWFECFELLKNKHIDLMPDVAITTERSKQLNFHREEVFSSWSTIYSRDDHRVNSIADLDAHRIAVLKGSIQHAFLEQLMKGFSYKTTFIEAKTYKEAFTLASNGSAEYVVSNHLYGDLFHQEYGLEKTSIVFNPVSLYFAAAKGSNYHLLHAIDKHLKEMKSKSGSVYYKSLQRWMEKPPKIVAPHYLNWLFGCIFVLLILTFGFIFVLRWKLNIETKHLADVNKNLAESEKKFRDIFTKHTAVKLLFDPENGNIVEANEAAEKFYGWPVEQLQKMHIQDIEVEFENNQLVPQELKHKLSDGTIKDVAIFTSSINIQGKTLIHCIIHDISAHRSIEEQLRQAQKMECVGRLAGGVAHDFNNMLSVIIGYTEMALEKAKPNGKLREYLNEIFSASKRSADITRQLLTFARKQSVNPRVLDLNTVIDGMLPMLRRLIGENIELEWQPSDELWKTKMDPSQIDQIMANLCVNARDAIEDIGKVIIETSNVTVTEECKDKQNYSVPGNYVLLSITDNGCGIEKELLCHLFEPFFTTKETGKGTGLGLASIYGIMKQNSCFINVFSKQGEGTTFKLYFPKYTGKSFKIDAVIT
ncbi:MAG: transporter substrate-binding domain-containing protein [Candidatus Riflebacteria bacterium]|nr:transporter substrate-binding domain-containing protein [Candidatus Riflebacteria bacterium]